MISFSAINIKWHSSSSDQISTFQHSPDTHKYRAHESLLRLFDTCPKMMNLCGCSLWKRTETTSPRSSTLILQLERKLASVIAESAASATLGTQFAIVRYQMLFCL